MKQKIERIWVIESENGIYYGCNAPSRLKAIQLHLSWWYGLSEQGKKLSGDQTKLWKARKSKGDRAVCYEIKKAKK